MIRSHLKKLVTASSNTEMPEDLGNNENYGPVWTRKYEGIEPPITSGFYRAEVSYSRHCDLYSNGLNIADKLLRNTWEIVYSSELLGKVDIPIVGIEHLALASTADMRLRFCTILHNGIHPILRMVLASPHGNGKGISNPNLAYDVRYFVSDNPEAVFDGINIRVGTFVSDGNIILSSTHLYLLNNKEELWRDNSKVCSILGANQEGSSAVLKEDVLVLTNRTEVRELYREDINPFRILRTPTNYVNSGVRKFHNLKSAVPLPVFDTSYMMLCEGR